MKGMYGSITIIAVVTTIHDMREMATVMHSTCSACAGTGDEKADHLEFMHAKHTQKQLSEQVTMLLLG